MRPRKHPIRPAQPEHRSAAPEQSAARGRNLTEPPALTAVGNLALGRALAARSIRAKLKVSQAADPDEQEAERVADYIMLIGAPMHPDASAARHPLAQKRWPTHEVIQRKCVACEGGSALCPNCEEEERIRRKESTLAISRPSTPVDSQIVGMNGGGESMSPSVRAFFEPRFGRDLGHVRVHIGREAADSARAIQARAYTVKNDIVFGEGQYSPESIDGKKLLAHELSHVMQQPHRMIARAVARDYPTIRSHLSYGILDWAITEAECDEVLSILTSLSPADLEDTVRRMQGDGLVARLAENASPTARTANATLLRRIQEIAQAGEPGGNAPAVASTTRPMPEVASRAPDTFDPCLVDVYALTNAGLLSYYQRVLPIVNRGRDDPGYFDNRNLQRRLITERDRRVALGHAWLATMPETIPQTLRRIVDGPSGSFKVLEVPGTTVAGAPEDHARSPLMTCAQFDRFLEENSIERVDAETYRMRRSPMPAAGAQTGTMFAVGGLYRTPFDYLVLDPYGRPILGTGGGEIMKWRGRLGEAAFASQPSGGVGLLYEDSNGRVWRDRLGRTHQPTEEAYPVFDFDRPTNQLVAEVLGVKRISVKTSFQPVQADRLAFFRRGLQDIYQTRQGSALPTYIANQPEYAGQPTIGPQYAANRSEVIAESVMAINEEDVADFRRLLNDPAQRESAQSTATLWEDRGGMQQGRFREGWRQVFEGAMREPPPITIDTASGGPQTFSTPDQLDQARQANQITAEEYTRMQRQVGARAASRVVGIGTASAELMSLRASRLRYGNLTPAQLEPALTPEFMRSERLGGGLPGEIRAGGAAGLQGAGAGGVIAIITTFGVMVFDEADHPDWARELGISGGLGGVGGGTGALTEQLVISSGTRVMLNAMRAGSPTSLTQGLVGGGGRLAGGAVGAMFVEGISIGLLEEREHFAPEVAMRLTRSAALGAGSVWAGAGIGAAAGSVVPVAGTAVGFVVGLVAGGILYYVGERAVPGGREDWDAYEAGCHFRPTAASAGGGEPAFHYCFTGETLTRMADGTDRRLDQLREGDSVLSYDERDASLRNGKVLKIERSIAPTHFKLRLAKNGVTVGVTGEHPIHSEGLWLPANLLRVGSIVTWLDDGIVGVGQTEITNVVTDSRPTPVYDLTVSDYHTFFAGGILAHNKNF